MASNLVVARGGVEFVPPISLAFWRWTLVFLILLPFTYITLKKNFKIILTGGLAHLFKTNISFKVLVDKNLTIKGLIKAHKILNK